MDLETGIPGRALLKVLRNEVWLMEGADRGDKVGYSYEVVLGSTTLFRTATVAGVDASHAGEDACRVALDYAEGVARELWVTPPKVQDSGRAEKMAGWIDSCGGY